MDLDPRLLKYFAAVAEELNFGRAATRVHLSQPSLSVAIRNLEATCGVKLFKRDSRHVELTEAGRRFIPVAREIIEKLDQAANFLQGVARGEPEIFRIGYSPFLDMQLVGSVRSEFIRENSGFPAVLIGSPTTTQIEALVKGDLHAGLLIAQEAPLLVIESLTREPFRIAFRRGHRLEQLDRLAICDIVEEPVVWFARDLNPAFHDRFFQDRAGSGYGPKIVQEVGTVLECLQFAGQGIGITFATRSQQSMNIDGIGFRELADERFYFETAVAYRADNRTDVLQRFIRFVRERFRDAP